MHRFQCRAPVPVPQTNTQLPRQECKPGAAAAGTCLWPSEHKTTGAEILICILICILPCAPLATGPCADLQSFISWCFVFILDIVGVCSSHLPDAGVLFHFIGHVELHLDRAVAVHQPPAAQRRALLGEGVRALCALQRLRNEPGVGRLIRRLVSRLLAILYIHVCTSDQNGVGIFCFEMCTRTSELADMKATSAACSAAAFSAVLKSRIAKCNH